MASPAPCLQLLVRQLDSRVPGRSKGLDGIMRNPGVGPPSDHHLGNALDVTHDPAHGLHAGRLAEELVRQMRGAPAGRLTYVIWDRRIASAKTGWAWRPYGRSCPHVRHAHFSVRNDRRGVIRPWSLDRAFP